MTEILQTTQRNLIKIEKKIARYSHHRIFLEKYKIYQKYPKGLSSKFNISFCSDSGDLQNSCQNILSNASFKLCDNVVTAVSKRIEDLKIVRNEYFHALKNNLPNDSFLGIWERITLLLFRDIIQSIKETIFQIWITIDRTDVFDVQITQKSQPGIESNTQNKWKISYRTSKSYLSRSKCN